MNNQPAGNMYGYSKDSQALLQFWLSLDYYEYILLSIINNRYPRNVLHYIAAEKHALYENIYNYSTVYNTAALPA
ncbi:hypothetical protein SpAn4DRAFT_1400 [Sporomusa ovata]|uniref:Uncharacterized protein n=1 Tax=Sporomusa ovata TaxID=2378 RepID=A0A0U1KSP8_9FIRM|nr:hypothetical protein SpAn4DRAFT_1400 [Sporomusa ovata]